MAWNEFDKHGTPRSRFLTPVADIPNEFLNSPSSVNTRTPATGVGDLGIGNRLASEGHLWGNASGRVVDPLRLSTSTPSQTTPNTPTVQGTWTDKASFGLGLADVAVDAFSAIQAAKMNKFMRSYYGNQMDMMKTDFNNAANDSRRNLEARSRAEISSQGINADSEEGQAYVANQMDKWAANTI